MSLVCIVRAVSTYINFTQDHINNTANNDEEVKYIPGVSKVTLSVERKKQTEKKTCKDQCLFMP